MTTRNGGIGLAQPRQVAHPPDHLLLRGFANGTRVDDDQVGRLEAVRFGATGRGSAPAISSESEWFIWQPSVQTWKLGRATSSVVNSASSSRNLRRAC